MDQPLGGSAFGLPMFPPTIKPARLPGIAIHLLRKPHILPCLSLFACVLLLSACGIEIGGSAELGRQSAGAGAAATAAHTPTALPGELLATADADYTLLANIYERASPSVVNIESGRINNDSGDISTQRGSGFVYDKQGHIITNAHLVNNAFQIRVTLQNAVVVDAQLLGADSFSDLAVLKVAADAARLNPLWIGESAGLKVGQRSIVISNPFGLSSSMTTGIVSGLGRTLPSAELLDGESMPGFENPSIIQIDAAINPGSSGGPLLDSGGRVIGLTTAIRSNSGQFQGIGFAVPADTMRRVIPELIERGRVDYSWMGISVMREDGGFGVAGLSGALDLPVDRGVLLRGVIEGSPADSAGLRGGDRLLEVRGESVCAGGDLLVAINDYHFADLDELVTYLVQNTRPGDVIELLAIRDKLTIEVKLTLQTHPVAGNQRLLDCSATG